MTNLADMSEGFPEKENGGFGAMVRLAAFVFVQIFMTTLLSVSKQS